MVQPFNEEIVTVSDASEVLGISRSRVRALLRSGALPGFKKEAVWFVSLREIWQRVSVPPVAGRPFEPKSAWALLALACEVRGETSGIVVEVTESRERYLRSRLRSEGFAQLASRLVRRARRQRFWVPPGELQRIWAEESLALSGISLSEQIGADLVVAGELEGYISCDNLSKLVQKCPLIAFSRRPNVMLHVVESWPFVRGLKEVPVPVAVLDLAESEEERTRNAGRRLMARLGV